MKTASSLVRIVFSLLLLTAAALPTSTALTDFPQLGIARPDDDCLPKYPPPPVVKIKVRVPACAEPGQAIEYRICVENCSTAEAHHVMVKNALPSNAKFVKADPKPSKEGEELHWNLGTVGGGAVREIVLVLMPTNKEDVKNCARVQFEHGQCVVTRQAGFQPGGQPFDPSKPPKISTVPDATDAPELDLVVRGPKDQYVNLPTKYEITITNKGKARATNAQVNARVPDQLKVVKASAPGIAVENVVAWNLGHLDPGASRVLELTLSATRAGEYCFKTIAEADRSAKLEKEWCTKFHGVSAMTIEMHDTEDPVFVGHKTSYPVVIRNQGSVPLTNIHLRAIVPDAMKFDKANVLTDKQVPVPGGLLLEFRALPEIPVGEQRTYTITCEAMKAGYTRFQVQVTADQLDAGRPVVEQESTTIVDDREQVQIKELSRTKSQ